MKEYAVCYKQMRRILKCVVSSKEDTEHVVTEIYATYQIMGYGATRVSSQLFIKVLLMRRIRVSNAPHLVLYQQNRKGIWHFFQESEPVTQTNKQHHKSYFYPYIKNSYPQFSYFVFRLNFKTNPPNPNLYSNQIGVYIV